jgi:hypothetical protein
MHIVMRIILVLGLRHNSYNIQGLDILTMQLVYIDRLIQILILGIKYY